MAKRLAILFDLDGTLVDTEKFHAAAEARLLNDFGIKMPPREITRKYAGLPTESYIEKLAGYRGALNELMSQKNRIMKSMVNEKGIRPIPGMLGLVRDLAGSGTPIFVVSSSDRSWIRRCLDVAFREKGKSYTYGDYFKLNFISGAEVKNPKPAADIFLEAKRRILKQRGSFGSPGTEWIVVGDSLADMEGALNAKMKAFILGTFRDRPAKNDNVAVFSTPKRLAVYLKNMIKVMAV